MGQADIGLEVEKALLGVILDKRCMNLSQASMFTDYELKQLFPARDSLIEKGLIRPVPGDYCTSELVPYEVNV